MKIVCVLKQTLLYGLAPLFPEGAHYPQESCKANGYECTNYSFGSSCLRFIPEHPARVYKNSGRQQTVIVSRHYTVKMKLLVL